MLKKKQIIFALLLVLFLWWFVGGSYFSNDTSDPVIGMKIRFPEKMMEVSPIPKLLMGKKLRKKFKRAIVSPATLKELARNGQSSVKAIPLPEDKFFYIKKLIHLKYYGVFASTFSANTSYYLLQDSKGIESIFFIRGNHEIFQ